MPYILRLWWITGRCFWLICILFTATCSGSMRTNTTVTPECGGNRTFTCSAACQQFPVWWAISGLKGINESNATAMTLKKKYSRIHSKDTYIFKSSTITITGFSEADNGGIVQCIHPKKRRNCEQATRAVVRKDTIIHVGKVTLYIEWKHFADRKGSLRYSNLPILKVRNMTQFCILLFCSRVKHQ